ncbi:TPA: hypothetical protein VDB83_001171 [Burkholderia cenocepacia]|uniref:DUF6582 domain-containing protein n=1 Tax=Burkholderia cenocepacia TaxID=95486 RepID=UPI001BA21877|nr:DUF6582 domain-containing protein [Burkholderia cenocepacia]MBR8096331.1 hypothetical protein [Burkholderia cenocepacia]HEP6426900.1 hypothetical protein [Burkholderia cenocepacia]
MPLTKEQRDALPSSEFAVPGKRALPMHDRDHTKMAWSMLDHTKGLSESEKSEAKRRILHRAKELGIDTSDWEAHQSARMDIQPAGENDGGLRAMHFEAMALDVPETPGHPNKIPFSGIMTRIDQPSDNPVGGANGKRVLIPRAVAEEALPSLLGMGVDYQSNLSGHDPTKKIGVITAATIEGDGVHIEGFLYGADFPAVVNEIRSKKRLLGFSYEAQAMVQDWNKDPVEVTSCVFTGAAILFKDKAAYTTTSLEASASTEIPEMDIKELMEAVKSAVKEETASLVKDVADLKASAGKLEAANVLHRVKEHSDRIRAAADCMEAAGMGGHERQGHVAVLRRMADKMEAEAVLGKLPHLWRDHDWLDAAADDGGEALKAANGQIAELAAKVKELEGKAFSAAAAPARPTDVAAAAKPGVHAAHTDIRAKDAELQAAGASTTQRLAAITMARMSGNA